MSGKLIAIRRRIKSAKNTQQITRAMKVVSASRQRKAMDRATRARPYAERIAEVHRSILGRMGEASGPLFREGAGKVLLVAIAGDKGLCGSFNANIFKAARALIRREGEANIVVLPIGKKAVQFFKKLEIETLPGYANIFRNVTSLLGEEISRKVVELFIDGPYQRVILLNNRAKNVLVQEVSQQTILPLSPDADAAQESGPGAFGRTEPRRNSERAFSACDHDANFSEFTGVLRG